MHIDGAFLHVDIRGISARGAKGLVILLSTISTPRSVISLGGDALLVHHGIRNATLQNYDRVALEQVLPALSAVRR